MPADHDVRIVIDNVSSHKTEAASWINQVERLFADLTEKQIRRGVHRTIAELETAITSYIATVNVNPRPFVWDQIR